MQAVCCMYCTYMFNKTGLRLLKCCVLTGNNMRCNISCTRWVMQTLSHTVSRVSTIQSTKR